MIGSIDINRQTLEMKMPSTLDPQVAAFLRVQMTIAAARAVEPMAERLHAAEEFNFGLLRVLGDIVPALLACDPDLADAVQGPWREATERFERLERGEALGAGETLDRLEARAQLYRLCTQRKVWPSSSKTRARGELKRGTGT